MNYKKLTVFLVLLISFFSVGYKANASVPVTGWAWSSTIGWVSMNCSNTNTCGTVDYKVVVSTSTTDETAGTFSGYAWSSNVGWIKFDPTPTASRPNPTIELPDASGNTTGSINGFIRACAGTITKDCNGADNPTWDGWIELSGDKHGTGYKSGAQGVSYDETLDKIVGHAWDPTNIGWLNFYDVNFDVDGVASTRPRVTLQVGDNSGFGSYSPNGRVTIASGASVPLKWTMSNIDNTFTCNTGTSQATWTEGTSPAALTAISNRQSSTAYSASFVNNTASPVDKTLRISCLKGLVSAGAPFIVVTVLPETGVSCVQPANSVKCTNAPTNTPDNLQLFETESMCSPSPTNCQYYCPAGYTKYENTCQKDGEVTET